MKKVFVFACLLLLSIGVQSHKIASPTGFSVCVQGGQGIVMFGVVTRASSATNLTVTYGSDTLINNRPIPAGLHYQRLDDGGWPIPETDFITVYGIDDT